MRTTSRRDERPPTGNTSGPTIHSRHVQLCVRDKLITAKMTAKKQRVAAEECDAAYRCKFDAKRCIAAMRGRKDAAHVIPMPLHARGRRRRSARGTPATPTRRRCHVRQLRHAQGHNLWRAHATGRAAAAPVAKHARRGARPVPAMPRGARGPRRPRRRHTPRSREKHKPRKPLTKKRTGASSSSRPSP